MTSKKGPFAFWISAVALGLALGMGLACGPGASPSREEGRQTAAGADAAQAATPSEPAAAAASPEAPSWLGGFRVGHTLDADGTIPSAQQAHDFTPGETVYVSMEVGHAPAGASVQVAFEDASGQVVAQDEKKVPLGATSLYFDSGDTSGWMPGDYRVEISVGGRSVNAQHFSLKPVDGAPK